MPESTAVHARGLILAGSAAVLLVGAGTAAARGRLAASRSGPVGGRLAAPRSRPVGGRITWAPNARPTKPDRADWDKIRAAAAVRAIALGPHKSAFFRSFSASLGLRELLSIQPLGPGRCATAVLDLYDNLLDLSNAYQGENWNPLRRLVAKEPSIQACAPPDRSPASRATLSTGYTPAAIV